MSGLQARMPADSEFDLVVLGDCNPDLVLTGNEIDPCSVRSSALWTRPT